MTYHTHHVTSSTYVLLATCYLLFAICYLLLATCYLLLTTDLARGGAQIRILVGIHIDQILGAVLRRSAADQLVVDVVGALVHSVLFTVRWWEVGV